MNSEDWISDERTDERKLGMSDWLTRAYALSFFLDQSILVGFFLEAFEEVDTNMVYFSNSIVIPLTWICAWISLFAQAGVFWKFYSMEFNIASISPSLRKEAVWISARIIGVAMLLLLFLLDFFFSLGNRCLIAMLVLQCLTTLLLAKSSFVVIRAGVN